VIVLGDMAEAGRHSSVAIEIRGPTGLLAARIVPAIARHFDQHELLWRPSLRLQDALDADWDWRSDFLSLELPAPDRETYAVELADGDSPVGLMSLIIGESDVYVERLAVEPESRTLPGQGPRYKGIGAALMVWAVQRSVDHGRKGRVSLHSLEDPHTLAFYRERIGMVEVGSELIDGELLKRFELSEERAATLLGGV
jgi:hypothetical protein